MPTVVSILGLRPGQVTQLVGASSHTPKGAGYNLVRAHTGGNRSVFLSFSLSHLPLPLSLKSINILLGED